MPSENKTTNIGLNQWQGNENLRRQDMVDDNAAIDTAIGNRTIDDTKIPNANENASLSTLLSWLGHMIKSITGKTSWRTAPVKSIEQLNNDSVTHSADTAAHGATSAATASKIIARDANGRAKVAAPSAADDIARKDTVDAVQTNLTTHTSAAAPHNGHIAHSLATAANDFLVASGAGTFVKKTLAEVKVILGLGSAAYTNSADYATAAQGTLATNAMPKNGGTFIGTVNYGRQIESQPQIKDYSETLVTNAGATGSVTINIANGNVIDLTLTGSVTLTFSNPAPSGQACSFTLKINMPATLYAVTWPATIKWDNDTAPTLTASKTAYFTFVTINGGTRWHGFVAATKLTT